MSKTRDRNKENPKTESLHIRISPEDKKLLMDYAEMSGVTLSRFVMTLVRRKRIIICKDQRYWGSILLGIFKQVQQMTNLARENKNVTPEQITELTDTMKILEKEVVRYIKYIEQPDKKTPDYAKYLKYLREVKDGLKEMNDHLDKLEPRLKRIESQLNFTNKG